MLNFSMSFCFTSVSDGRFPNGLTGVEPLDLAAGYYSTILEIRSLKNFILSWSAD